MSQSLEISLVLASVEFLADAIASLGATLRECRQLRTRDGRSHTVDRVATDVDGTEVGVRIDPRTQQAVLVSEGCGSKAQAFAQRIAQRYAYARVTDELRRKGYDLGQESRAPDGTVRLVATRWGA
ncbi:MAG TPA: DUF1257 domain-containing protein [Myxococcota bacterium]|nr:DUF1257 domain-containing protein [Myxococcota bacterium]